MAENRDLNIQSTCSTGTKLLTQVEGDSSPRGKQSGLRWETSEDIPLTALTAIHQSAEAICPGVTQRITSADFTAIVMATVQTVAAVSPTNKRLRLNPPIGEVADLLRARREIVFALGSAQSVSAPKQCLVML